MDRVTVKREQLREVLEDRHRLGDGLPLTVGQVMSVAPTCLPAGVSVLELVHLFNVKGFRHLLVTNEAGQVQGVISDRDVIRCLGPLDSPDRDALARMTARDVMSTDIITVAPNTPLEQAVSTMVGQGISSLPVVAAGALVGILTNTDLQLTLELLLETSRELNNSSEPATA